MPRWAEGDVVGHFTLLRLIAGSEWRARCRCGGESDIVPSRLFRRTTDRRPVMCRACTLARRAAERPEEPRCGGCGTTEPSKFPRSGGRRQCMACEQARLRNGACKRCDRPLRLTRVCPCVPAREVPAERLRLLKRRLEAQRRARRGR